MCTLSLAMGTQCGLGACWGCHKKLARAPHSFQLVSLASFLGVNKCVCVCVCVCACVCVCVFFTSRVLVSCSSPLSPTGFQTSYEDSSSGCWTPGLRCPIWVMSPSLAREDSWVSDSPTSSVSPARTMGPEPVASPPFLLYFQCVFPHRLGYTRAFLPVFS